MLLVGIPASPARASNSAFCATLAAIMLPVLMVNDSRYQANVRDEASFIVACGPMTYPGSGVTVIVRDLKVRSVSRLQPSR